MNFTLNELKLIESLLRSANTEQAKELREKEDLLHKVQKRINHIEYQGEIIRKMKQSQTNVYVC